MRARLYRQGHLTGEAARQAKYHKTPAGQAASKCQHHRRRALVTATPPDRMLTREQWNVILDMSKGRCYWCGKRRKPTLDHVIPLSKGGLHVAENVVVSCLSCNSKKQAKILTLL